MDELCDMVPGNRPEQRIKYARMHRGLPKSRVAEALECNRDVITSIEEARHSCRFNKMIQLAEFYGVSLSWVYGQKEEMDYTPVKYIGGTLGSRIKDARVKQCIEQGDLADKVGVTDCMVSEWEHDRHNPSEFNAFCIAQALGVQMDYLAGWEE